MRKIKEIRRDIRALEDKLKRARKDIRIFKMLKALIYLVIGAVMIWTLWHLSAWVVLGRDVLPSTLRMMFALYVLSIVIFNVLPSVISKEINRLRQQNYELHDKLTKLQIELLVSVNDLQSRVVEEETP